MTCIARFNIQSEGVYITAMEHCRKIIFGIYVHQTSCTQRLSVNNVTSVVRRLSCLCPP